MSDFYYGKVITSTTITDYVERRLDNWATWAMRKLGGGIGFPGQSIEYRIMTEGIIPIGNRGVPTIETNPFAQEVELLIAELYAQKKEMAEMLCNYYLRHGSFREKAKQMQLSTTQLHGLVSTGRLWLNGWYSAELFSERIQKNLMRVLK